LSQQAPRNQEIQVLRVRSEALPVTSGSPRPLPNFLWSAPPEFQVGDVMITIFGEKKMAFFSKTNVMIKILHTLALF
jgi:hypothetical protein